MSSFKLLKKQSKEKDALESLVEKLKQEENPNRDDNAGEFWKLTKNADDTGSAIIRFLPAAEGDEDSAIPVVKMYSHGFKGKTGKWYIENSLTTIGKDDPASDYNSKLWATGDEALQNFVRKNSKRRLEYIANILVVMDPKAPENNGKVFKFKFGKKIFEKIASAMKGNTALGKKGVNVFCFWNGADFEINVKKKDGYFNYDDSKFETPSVIHLEDGEPLSDEDIESKIYANQFTLKDEISADKFKSYDVLQAKLNSVLGLQSTEAPSSSGSVTKNEVSTDENDEEEDDIPASFTENSGTEDKKTVDEVFAELDLD